MKTFEEKEKKLKNAITQLDSVNYNLNDLKTTLSDLELEKNQLKIEKNEIEKKYLSLINEHQILKNQIIKFNRDNFKKPEVDQEFSKKIDELNQETDTLLEEIDKWQM